VKFSKALGAKGGMNVSTRGNEFSKVAAGRIGINLSGIASFRRFFEAA
jgi:hypothetical protein